MKHLIPVPKQYLTGIDAGFHSFTTRSSTLSSRYPNVICIIPKGAEYCIGVANEIVSTQLIVFKHKWNYLWYKLWHR